MGSEAENVAILGNAYETWSRSRGANTDCWLSIVAEDARLTSFASMPVGDSPRISKSEIIDYLNALTADWEMLFYRIDEYVAQGDRVVAVGSTSWRNKQSGKIAATPKIDLWRMRDGRVVQFAEFREPARVCRSCKALTEAAPALPHASRY